MTKLREKQIDAWMKQSELMWRTAYTTPAYAIAVFGGWYVSLKDGFESIANLILWAGIALMLVQWMVVHRMADYLNVFRSRVDQDLPRVENKDIMIIGYRVHYPSGHTLAKSIPLIMCALFAAMLLAPSDQPNRQPTNTESCPKG